MVIGRRSLLLAGVAVPAAAASARAECVTDTPAVDACRGGVRITQPPGVTLDLSFFGPTLDPSLTFTRGSTATYIDSSGTMQTVSGNTPRFDYDPVTHAALGLLIEESRTNALLNSGNLASGSWTLSSVTAATGSDAAPMSPQMMTRISEVTATAQMFLTQNITTVASSTYTGTVYAKVGQTRYLQVACDDFNNGAYATFDLQTGTVSGALTARGTGVAVGATIVAVGNGVYRCSVSATLGAVTTGRMALVLANTGAPGFAQSYAGNAANGLSIWGTQLEQGAFPTSYIPTTAAAVTRSADQCSILPAQMGFYTPPGGSWQLEFICNSFSTTNYKRTLSQLPGPSNLSPVLIDITNPPHVGQYDGTLLFSGNTTTAGAVTKIATTVAGTVGKACLNGGAVASGAVTGGYAVLGTQGVGLLGYAGATAVETTTGYIRRLRYWPRVLSNAELQQVTR